MPGLLALPAHSSDFASSQAVKHISVLPTVKCVSHMENCLGVDKERLNINLQRAEECMYVS